MLYSLGKDCCRNCIWLLMMLKYIRHHYYSYQPRKSWRRISLLTKDCTRFPHFLISFVRDWKVPVLHLIWAYPERLFSLFTYHGNITAEEVIDAIFIRGDASAGPALVCTEVQSGRYILVSEFSLGKSLLTECSIVTAWAVGMPCMCHFWFAEYNAIAWTLIGIEAHNLWHAVTSATNLF